MRKNGTNSLNSQHEYNKTNEILETIGQKVLDSWNSDDESMESFLFNDPTSKLNEILQTPYSSFDINQLDKLQEIINVFQPQDYALYGKQICQYMINFQKYQYKQNQVSNNSSKCVQKQMKENKDYKIHSKNTRKKNLFTSFPEWIPTIASFDS